jgi:hypothetical protein
LGIKHTAAITGVAAGAKWIWNQVEKHPPGAAGVLDIYHLSAPLRHGSSPLGRGDGVGAGLG